MPAPIDRRSFLSNSLGVAAAAAVGLRVNAQSPGEPVVRDYVLTARPSTVFTADGRPWETWTYNGQVPGPELRVREGERLRVTLDNQLPEPTTIHWHGIPLPNPMDGVPDVTQPAVMPGERFTYEFLATTPGTYFYHSHVGLQLDRGLVGSLVIEPRTDTLAVDREQTLVLDDWLTMTPEEAMAAMATSPGGGMGMGGGMMGGMASSDPAYAGYLANGRITAGAAPITIRPGERLRLRIVNAAAATTFRLGLTGHRLVVTHTDGQEVEPVTVDTLIIGMGERYDVVVEGTNRGAWAVIAGSADSTVPGVVVPFVYEGEQGTTAPPFVWPTALLNGRTLRYGDLAGRGLGLNASTSARAIPLTLSGPMMGGTTWTINGVPYASAAPITIREGERIRLQFRNASMVRHPMHLHGHFFEIVDPASGRPTGLVKDTVLVEPMGQVHVDFMADNPGRWLMHCHHAYHMEAGMARLVEYR